MRITMENCGNIEIGDLQIKPGLINIKYGRPGCGKSVLARAIRAFIQDDPGEKEALGAGSEMEPELFGYESLSSVACFDERFTGRFDWRRSKREGVAFELTVRPEPIPEQGKRPRRVNKPLPCNITLLSKEAKDAINEALAYLHYDVRLTVEEGDGELTPLYNVVLVKAEDADKIWIQPAYEEDGSISKDLELVIAFMVFRRYAVKMDPSLILIDEPDREYSKNVIYIIMKAMFFWENGFQEKTVLFLTGQRYVIADCMFYLKDDFKETPYVCYMTNEGGELTEIPILPEDVNTAEALAEMHVNAPVDVFYRLLFLQCSLGNLSVLTPGGMMLDSLFRGLTLPEFHVRGAGIRRPMSEEEYRTAQKEIQLYVPEFNYEKELLRWRDVKTMAKIYRSGRSRYEKMILYLAMFRDKEQHPKIVRYLIGEFLREEEMILRVDPVKFDSIPTDIMRLCDAAVRKLQKKT